MCIKKFTIKNICQNVCTIFQFVFELAKTRAALWWTGEKNANMFQADNNFFFEKFY